jgi:hypothetical protein
VWPKELGEVSRSQWIAKNRVETRKRTVPLKAEIQKGNRQMEQTIRILHGTQERAILRDGGGRPRMR